MVFQGWDSAEANEGNALTALEGTSPAGVSCTCRKTIPVAQQECLMQPPHYKEKGKARIPSHSGRLLDMLSDIASWACHKNLDKLTTSASLRENGTVPHQGRVVMAVQVGKEEACRSSTGGHEESHTELPTGCIILQQRAEGC